MMAGPQLSLLLSERVVNIWNSLYDQSVTVSSLNSFKNNLSRLRRQSMGLYGQLCSLTLEAIQSSGLAASGK